MRVNENIDSKFSIELWEDLEDLSNNASSEEITEKINELVEYTNYIMRFIIGKTD